MNITNTRELITAIETTAKDKFTITYVVENDEVTTISANIEQLATEETISRLVGTISWSQQKTTANIFGDLSNYTKDFEKIKSEIIESHTKAANDDEQL